MKDYEIHKLIEQQNPEEKERLWQRIKAELDLPDSPPTTPAPVAAKPKVWRRWTAIAAALVCVITLSIVLPLTLDGENERYCDFEHYTTASLEQNLGDYFSSNNKDLLSVDWYDIAEEVKTEYGHMKENKNDIVFFGETILNGETGESLTLYVTDNKTRVDILEDYYNDCNSTKVRDVTVQYKSDRLSSQAVFNYRNNIYYLELDVGNAQERLTEIIESMLP